jgi:pimeloyl-ACP methyl ester carboxylesterase
MNIGAGIVAILVSAAPLTAVASQTKPTIVLVHGAFETADVWGYVSGKLQHDGYKVVTVDLPGRPGNPMPIGEVTMGRYQRAVAAAIAYERRPVVLVGHSFAGIVISAEAEAEPAKIKTLVYVAAYIPQNGDSLLTLATSDKNSKLGPLLKIEKDKGIASVDPAAGAAVFANDAPAPVQDAVAKAIVDEPLGPLATPVTLTASRFGRVDKVAIHTLRDEVVSPALQASMAKSTALRLQLTINTGHTPFITQPNALAAEIEKAAK